MENARCTAPVIPKIILSDKKSRSTFRIFLAGALMLPVLLSACGGGGGNKSDSKQPPSIVTVISSASSTNSSLTVSSLSSSSSSSLSSSTIEFEGSGLDYEAPTVTDVQVYGNFGVVKLNAIVNDDVGVSDVEFLIDGTLVALGHLNTRPDAPENQYYRLYDVSTLSSGPHRFVVRARDFHYKVTTANEIIFNVDPTAGLTEIEPNDDMASANVVADNQFQISGNLKNFKLNSQVKIDYDFYKVTVPAGKTMTVTTWGLPSSVLVSILDSNGNIMPGDSEQQTQEQEESYTNGATSTLVYIRINAGFVVYARDRYRIALSFK